MKIRQKTSVVALLILVSSLPSLAGPTAPPANAPAATPPKPYTLFMGADFSVEWQGRPRPIKGADERGFVIDVDGSRVNVSFDRGDLKIQGHQALKVAPTGIAISKFAIERAYTPANDPQRAREIAANNAAGMAAKMESERYHADLQIAQIGTMESGIPTAYGPDPKQNLPTVQSAYGNLQAQMLADQGGSMQALNAPGAAGAGQDRCDAFRLSFDIAAPTPATGVYAVLVAQVRDPADPAGPGQIWILGKEIGDIGPKAKTVQLFRGGFPPGYALAGTQVHLYRDGTELATNLAPKHVEITADEAFQLSVASYVSQHHGADAPAAPANAGLSGAVRARLGADELGRSYYVKVDKNGLPQGAFRDEACTQPVTGEPLASALAGLRYYPALKAGKPVASVVPVRL
ncbi:MAG TPA: hypothetical protein VMD31_04990 [Opitutaceae bacterium]|nr:hypothetical protein [Opitutaceae bacterium]